MTSEAERVRLSRFVHDARTPLAAIRMAAEVLAAGDAPPLTPAEIQRLTNGVVQAVEELEGLLARLRDGLEAT